MYCINVHHCKQTKIEKVRRLSVSLNNIVGWCSVLDFVRYKFIHSICSTEWDFQSEISQSLESMQFRCTDLWSLMKIDKQHCCLVFCQISECQKCFNTWTDVDLSSLKSSDNNLRAINEKDTSAIKYYIHLKTTDPKFHSNIPGINELMTRSLGYLQSIPS